jgi:hypothetical protein
MEKKNHVRANHLHYDIPQSFVNKFIKTLATVIVFFVLAGFLVKIVFL